MDPPLIEVTIYPVHVFVFRDSSNLIDELSIVGEDVLDVYEGVGCDFRCIQRFVHKDIFRG